MTEETLSPEEQMLRGIIRDRIRQKRQAAPMLNNLARVTERMNFEILLSRLGNPHQASTTQLEELLKDIVDAAISVRQLPLGIVRADKRAQDIIIPFFRTAIDMKRLDLRPELSPNPEEVFAIAKEEYRGFQTRLVLL